jgi:hypothetical protein
VIGLCETKQNLATPGLLVAGIRIGIAIATGIIVVAIGTSMFLAIRLLREEVVVIGR